MPILIAMLVFGIVILVHEFGHFIAARRAGILVTEFAIGMGPKLIGIKRGETLFTIRALPIGGFCQMYGDEADALDKEDDTLDHESLKDKSFNFKTIPQRLSVMFAGSFMNFVLAFVLFFILMGLQGLSTTTISHVEPNTPAEAAGIIPGDQITHLNGRRIFLWDDLTFETAMGYGRPIQLGLLREDTRYTVTIVPQQIGERYRIGVASVPRAGWIGDVPDGFYRASFTEVLTSSFMRIGFVVRMVATTLFRLVTAPLTVIDQIAGPVGIVNMMGYQYTATVEFAAEVEAATTTTILWVFISMANFGALISANLGVMNLLPLPALDGGRIVFLLLEGVRRKPISPEREGMVHFAGFVLLLMTIVLITYQDILNIIAG